MRCFVAVEVGKEVKDQVYEVQRSFKGLAKVKWVAKKNVHVTLKFLGEIDNKKLEEVKNALRKVEFDAFKLKAGRIGVFPDWGNIRVVWLSLLPEKDLIGLQQKVDGELLGMVEGDQKFKSHLTIGRVKQVKKKEFVDKLKEVKIEGDFNVESFKLYSSVLSKDGPQYRLIEEYNSF
tara:strand:+ start:229 stop:759 length:531 start_codon:yes stop_codon:yes gene_type:complete